MTIRNENTLLNIGLYTEDLIKEINKKLVTEDENLKKEVCKIITNQFFKEISIDNDKNRQ